MLSWSCPALTPIPSKHMSQLPAVVQREKPRASGDECSPVVRIQKMIFEEAATLDASDIHIEPNQGPARVRYRIDGVLREALEVPRWMHENLVVRIKVLAKLDMSERSLPQDGQITSEEGNGFFFSSRRRHTRSDRDWSSDVCSSD